MYFPCKYCGKRLVSAENLENHYCENRKKELVLPTKIGRSAFYYYKMWREKMKFTVATQESFLSSRYFKSFINFVEFAKMHMIPDKTGYIDLMISKKIEPSYWSNDYYYNYYKEMFDSLYSPIKQYEMSLDYLMKISTGLDCPVNKVLEKIPPIDLMKLISNKKLSPWLLLFMNSFQDLVKYNLSKEHQILINAVINSDIWKKKILDKADDVIAIKDAVKKLNI